MGYEVTALTTALPDEKNGIVQEDGTEVHYLSGTRPGESDPLFWEASAARFDVLHAEQPFDFVLGRGKTTWGFHHRSRFSGTVPVLAHEGTYPAWLYQVERRVGALALPLTPMLAALLAVRNRTYRRCLQLADRVVCLSPDLAMGLRRAYWWRPPRTVAVSYGFDTRPFEVTPIHLEEVPRIVFVGRLARDKGVMALPRILSRMQHESAAIEVIGPGGPSVIAAVRRAAEGLGVSERLILSGPEHNDRLPSRLAGARAFLFPSTHPEGLSKVVLEAMAAALPVVAYKVPGIDVMVKNDVTGWIVSPRDEAAAAARLDSLLSDPECALRMGQVGRQHIIDTFAPEVIENQWRSLLGEVLIERGATSRPS